MANLKIIDTSSVPVIPLGLGPVKSVEPGFNQSALGKLYGMYSSLLKLQDMEEKGTLQQR